MRFQSSIDIWKIIVDARAELAKGERDKPEQYKVFLLAVCAGLRRSEIDMLEWDAFDFKNHTVRITSTEFLNPKTEESRASVEIDPEIAGIFSVLAKQAPGRFVVESSGQIVGARSGLIIAVARCLLALLAGFEEREFAP
jgi:integrase